MTASLIGFYILAALLVAASLLVILQRNVVHSAMALVAALFLVAVFFFILHAPLIGVLQVLVYAGAIMVLFLFVIMLLSPTVVEQRRFWSLGGAAAFLLAVILVTFIAVQPPAVDPVPPPELFGSPEMVGRSLFTDFLLPFEIVAVLLLVAALMVVPVAAGSKVAHSFAATLRWSVVIGAGAAWAGLDCYVFVPADLERAKIVATSAFGATVVAVEGTYDDVNRLCAQIADRFEWGIVNVNLRGYYGEGSKTVAFEIAEQLGWRLPTAVVAPMAGGSLVTKLRRGFAEWQEAGLVGDAPPRLYGAQAEGCAPIVLLVAHATLRLARRDLVLGCSLDRGASNHHFRRSRPQHPISHWRYERRLMVRESSCRPRMVHDGR